MVAVSVAHGRWLAAGGGTGAGAGGWLHVEAHSGKAGWVPADCLDIYGEVPAAPSASASASVSASASNRNNDQVSDLFAAAPPSSPPRAPAPAPSAWTPPPEPQPPPLPPPEPPVWDDSWRRGISEVAQRMLADQPEAAADGVPRYHPAELSDAGQAALRAAANSPGQASEGEAATSPPIDQLPPPPALADGLPQPPALSDDR